MKKSIFTIAILLSIFSITFTSCNKDEPDGPIQLDGTYKLVMNGNTVAEGTSEEVGMVGNAVSISDGEDLAILVFGVPETVGGEAVVGDSGSACSVSITGKNILESGADEMYFSISGTVKRTSASKVTFEGTCSSMGGTTIYTFSGNVESDAFKII